MITLFLAALAAPSAPARAASAPADLDLRCYGVMALLARDENPRVRTLGMTAAAYFLGRIDAAAPGYEVSGAATGGNEADRTALIALCSAELTASGVALGSAAEEPGASL